MNEAKTEVEVVETSEDFALTEAQDSPDELSTENDATEAEATVVSEVEEELVEAAADEPKMSDAEVKAAIEAILFAADEPLTKRDFNKVLKDAGTAMIGRALTQLMLEYEGGRGIHLVEINNGYQLRTNPELSTYIVSLFEAKPTRISKAAMETLAIVAYQQPIVKSRIDEIRGVDCTSSIKKLIELDFVVVVGQADDIGRPNLYATTERFLHHFGLKTITELPTLETFEIDALELVGEDLKEFLPDDEREEILSEHVAAAEHETGLDERVERAVRNEETEPDVHPSSGANDDGIRSEEE